MLHLGQIKKKKNQKLKHVRKTSPDIL